MKLTNGRLITDPACATKDEAKAKQIHCRFCELEGHLVIFHRNYTGLPTMTITDHNGDTREVRACIACHCCCEVGKWMRACSTKDIQDRTPELQNVGKGPLKNWSPHDPRLPEPNDDDPPADWKAFRRWLEKQPGSAVKVVYPQYEGNRNQARREMGITKPTDP